MAKDVEPKTKNVRENDIRIDRGWAYGLGALLIVLIVIMAGVGIAARHERFNDEMPLGGFRTSQTGRPHGYMMGGETNVNTANRVNGVVTAVNGSSFTVAGFGSTTNVATDNSTKYQGGNTVKVNDTVVVIGTTNNGTLTATHISINP